MKKSIKYFENNLDRLCFGTLAIIYLIDNIDSFISGLRDGFNSVLF
ncbi:hypothetical protein DI53_0697 [Sphingobacterium deserti]|uniref:Uncharacterized protein n=1 Tax=Sphingobacterium deserti TaxID=1229276 RepID=A0A0B8T582_9SPHI|nr:hypothetical protein DI53_0697 [Sphingobacterium deserti]